jgi:hypothetical protein
MVLNETYQLVLVIEAGAQVLAHALRVVAYKPVVESLVVAIVETELLQFPFQVPIGFCEK